MLKWIATFIINRLILLTLGYFVFTFFTGHTQSLRNTMTERIETFEAPFKTLSRALD